MILNEVREMTVSVWYLHYGIVLSLTILVATTAYIR